MKSKIHLLTFLIAFCTYSTYAQITTTIDEVYVNGQTSVTNCNTIDFEITANNTLTFYYILTKPQSSSGEGYLKIKLKYNSSSNGAERGTQYITPNLWNGNEYNHTIATNIDASEVQVSGSSIYLEFTEVSSPFEYYNSCEHPIIKTPTPSFTLSPTSVSLSCGDTSSRTFTVTPSNIPSGANVTYSWSHNGWSVANSTTTSRTLQPNSGTVLPASVSVTPSINGVAQQTKTSSVSRAPFSTLATITGSNSLCSTATYSVNNLPNGGSVSSWSVSNSNIATIIGNGNQATLTATGNGTVAITSTITNACGQTKSITKTNVNVGSPTVSSSNHINGGNDNVSVSSTSSFNVNSAIGNTHYYWFITTVNSNCGNSTQNPPRFYSNGNNYSSTYTSSYNSASINWGDCPGTYVVNCRAVNSCGSSDYRYKTVKVYSRDDIPCDQDPVEVLRTDQLKIYPNPVKNGTITVNRLPPSIPCDDFGLARNDVIVNEITIIDFYGNIIYKNIFDSNEFSIDVSNLKKGNYIVNLSSPESENKKKIIVVE